MAGGKVVLVQSSRTGRYLKRHPNDLKLYNGHCANINKDNTLDNEGDLLQAWREAFESLDCSPEVDSDCANTFLHQPDIEPENIDATAEQLPRRSQRVGTQNPRYYNEDFVMN